MKPAGLLRAAATALLACALTPGSVIAEDRPEEPARAFVQVVPQRLTCFVGESVSIELRIGIDRAYFDEHAVQQFRRELDVPVRVIAPWWDDLSVPSLAGGADDGPAAGEDGSSLAVNDAVVRATTEDRETRDGRSFDVHRLVRVLLPEQEGVVEFPAPRLRYAHAQRFEDDFLNGRVGIDPQDGFVDGGGAQLTVRPLPTENRPESFFGAIGEFQLTSATSVERVRVGETFQITLTVSGSGNLARFATPRFDDVPGLHVFGSVDDRGARTRTIVYDVAARAVEPLPALGMWCFDPSSESYLRVEALPFALQIDAALSADAADVVPPAVDESGDDLPAPVTLLLLVLVLGGLVLAVIALLWKRRAPTEIDPIALRRETALASLRAGVQGAPADALAQFLAVWLDCTAAAVISPELVSRLTAAGIDRELAVRTAHTLEGLVASRYGGQPIAPADEHTVTELAVCLERAFLGKNVGKNVGGTSGKPTSG